MRAFDIAKGIKLVEGYTLITPARLWNLHNACALTRGLNADMAELGVYMGGSARLIGTTRPGVTLHLYDTFEGLPHDEEDRFSHESAPLKKGQFSFSRVGVEAFLDGLPVRFHKGVFPKTAADVPVSFVHVDCDLYDAARAAIDWFWPRLLDGGVMFFDDYNCAFTGVTEAIHETFKEEHIMEQYAEDGVPMGCYVQK